MGLCEKSSDEPGKWRQFLAAVIINVSAAAGGMLAGWASPIIPLLGKEDTPVGTEPMTLDQISWLSSIMTITPLIALPFCAWSAEQLGRKITGYFIGIAILISWLLTIVAQDFYYLLVARMFAGLSLGLTFTLIPVYVAEISSESIRGLLGSFLGFNINIGVLVAFTLGAVLSYQNFAICGIVIPLIFFGGFFFMPETPIYLLRKGRAGAAIRSLMWLKNNDRVAVDAEMVQLQNRVNELSQSNKFVNLKDLFRDRGTTKGFIIAMGLFTGQQTSGFSVVSTYTASIFELANTSLTPNLAAIIISLMQIVGSWLSTLTIERAGRKSLILLSCAGMTTCHLIFGILFLLQSQKYDTSSVSWLPIAALSCYAISYSVGLGPAAYVVAAEILQSDIVSLGISMSMVPTFIAAFITTKFFPLVSEKFGHHVSFFILASFCASTFLFTYLLLPETKGRSIESIFAELNKTSRHTANDVSSDKAITVTK